MCINRTLPNPTALSRLHFEFVKYFASKLEALESFLSAFNLEALESFLSAHISTVCSFGVETWNLGFLPQSSMVHTLFIEAVQVCTVCMFRTMLQFSVEEIGCNKQRCIDSWLMAICCWRK
jgi:uncharacterized membrane protein